MVMLRTVTTTPCERAEAEAEAPRAPEGKTRPSEGPGEKEEEGASKPSLAWLKQTGPSSGSVDVLSNGVARMRVREGGGHVREGCWGGESGAKGVTQ